MKNQSFWRKLGDFAMGKGFYIVLFLCVATIGISGYYLLQTVMGGLRSTEPVGGGASVTIPDQSVTRPSVPAPSVTEPEVASPPPVVSKPQAVTPSQPDDPEPVKDDTPEPDTSKTLSNVFTWPVKGAVLREYSVETLSYDPTLEDWRTHGGLDIAADKGVQVLSISAGTVEQIYDDGLMGTTVVVNHGGGLRSWYSNLDAETAVQVGDSVDIGGILGTVGSTAIAEAGVASHIHLETDLNGKPVDPRDYLS